MVAEALSSGAASPASLSLAEESVAVLRAMVRVGLAMIETLPAACAEEGARAEASRAYDRITRSMRLSLALAGKLQAEAEASPAAQAARAAEQTRINRQASGFVAKDTTAFIVEQVVEAEVGERLTEREGERLLAGMYAEMNAADDLEEFADRPVVESVAMVCEALGLAFDPADWLDEDWIDDDWRDWARRGWGVFARREPAAEAPEISPSG